MRCCGRLQMFGNPCSTEPAFWPVPQILSRMPRTSRMHPAPASRTAHWCSSAWLVACSYPKEWYLGQFLRINHQYPCRKTPPAQLDWTAALMVRLSCLATPSPKTRLLANPGSLTQQPCHMVS